MRQGTEIAGLGMQESCGILPLTCCVTLNKLPWLLCLLSVILNHIITLSERDGYAQCQHQHPLNPCWSLCKCCCSTTTTQAFSPRALKVIQKYSCCSSFWCHKRDSCYSCTVLPLGFEGARHFACSCFSHVATLLPVTKSARVTVSVVSHSSDVY